MKNQEEEKIVYEIDDFESQCHLWNIVPGGSGKDIVLLRKLVDAMQHDSYSKNRNKNPSFLITGASGKQLVIHALINSLALIDVRICHGKYYENDIPSFQFFEDSYSITAHVITDLEKLRGRGESTLWRYLNNRECSYYNNMNKSFDRLIYCNGLIIMSCHSTALVPPTILKATDHIIRLEPLTSDQMLAVIHQRLVFCDIEYEGDEILRAIIESGNSQIDSEIEFLKLSIMLFKTGISDCLDMKVVNKARRMWQVPVGLPPPESDIPY